MLALGRITRALPDHHSALKSLESAPAATDSVEILHVLTATMGICEKCFSSKYQMFLNSLVQFVFLLY